MNVQSARFNADGDILAVIDGIDWTVPAGANNSVSDAISEWEAAGNTIVDYAVPSVSPEQVTAERDRRINGGFTFNEVRFDANTEARENIAGAYSAALTAVVNGAQAGDLRWNDPDTDFEWIAKDNSKVAMDAQTVMQFGQAALVWKQGHIFAARTLKDMEPIPADYAEDTYWPG